MKDNVELQRTILTYVLMFIASLFIIFIITEIRVRSKRYEYFREGKMGISNQCYMNEKDDPMCLIDGNFIWVDEYYEKD